MTEQEMTSELRRIGAEGGLEERDVSNFAAIVKEVLVGFHSRRVDPWWDRKGVSSKVQQPLRSSERDAVIAAFDSQRRIVLTALEQLRAISDSAPDVVSIYSPLFESYLHVVSSVISLTLSEFEATHPKPKGRIPYAAFRALAKTIFACFRMCGGQGRYWHCQIDDTYQGTAIDVIEQTIEVLPGVLPNNLLPPASSRRRQIAAAIAEYDESAVDDVRITSVGSPSDADDSAAEDM